MKDIKDIIKMIDLFYANKHLHDKIVAYQSNKK